MQNNLKGPTQILIMFARPNITYVAIAAIAFFSTTIPL
jgi:hypothetical protein